MKFQKLIIKRRKSKNHERQKLANRYSRAWRRPSSFFNLPEVTEGPREKNDDEQADEAENPNYYNEFNSDDEINDEFGGGRRKMSKPLIYSSNSSLESEGEIAYEIKRRKNIRKDSIFPTHPGLQNWVQQQQFKSIVDGSSCSRRDSGLDLLSIGRKRKMTYEEIKDLILNGKIKEGKRVIRESDWEAGESIRSRLWPLLCSIHEVSEKNSGGDDFYWETVKQLFGTSESLPEEPISLPNFSSSDHLHFYELADDGKVLTKRVISIIGYAFPDITSSPLLLPLASLFLHFVPEEKTYDNLCTLLSAKSKVFLTQTKLQWDVINATAMQLTKKFSKSAFVFLTRNLKNNESIEKIFENWIWFIFRDLPFHHLSRVVDCFLMEGIKLLYRVNIAILLNFSKTCASDSKISAHLEKQGIESAISEYCKNIPMSPQRLLKSAFSIRNFRGTEIRKTTVKSEMLLKGAAPTLKKLHRLNSTDNMPTSDSQHNVQMMSHTLAIKESEISNETKMMINDLKSNATPKDGLLTLWSWLPLRITMTKPVLLYTTDEHGSSLTTFFNRVEAHEPTVMIIKSTSDHIFGAYCSTAWAVRNEKDERGDRQRYFGTGECFLFTLSPVKAKYPWIGILNYARRNSLNESEDEHSSGGFGGTNNGSSKMDHGCELFMHADNTCITIGGGQGQGIRLDEDLRYGKSEHCLTFNNPPLTSEKDFEIRVLEIFGFEAE